MRVADLAKELNTTSDTILKTLKSLRLKAKDDAQELNKAVEIVVRSQFAKGIVSTSVKPDKVAKSADVTSTLRKELVSPSRTDRSAEKIGRASCRERVCQYV